MINVIPPWKNASVDGESVDNVSVDAILTDLCSLEEFNPSAFVFSINSAKERERAGGEGGGLGKLGER